MDSDEARLRVLLHGRAGGVDDGPSRRRIPRDGAAPDLLIKPGVRGRVDVLVPYALACAPCSGGSGLLRRRGLLRWRGLLRRRPGGGAAAANGKFDHGGAGALQPKPSRVVMLVFVAAAAAAAAAIARAGELHLLVVVPRVVPVIAMAAPPAARLSAPPATIASHHAKLQPESRKNPTDHHPFMPPAPTVQRDMWEDFERAHEATERLLDWLVQAAERLGCIGREAQQLRR